MGNFGFTAVSILNVFPLYSDGVTLRFSNATLKKIRLVKSGFVLSSVHQFLRYDFAVSQFHFGKIDALGESKIAGERF